MWEDHNLEIERRDPAREERRNRLCDSIVNRQGLPSHLIGKAFAKGRMGRHSFVERLKLKRDDGDVVWRFSDVHSVSHQCAQGTLQRASWRLRVIRHRRSGLDAKL